MSQTSVGLWSVIQARQQFFQHYGPLAFALDYLLNVGVVVLAMTLYANTPLMLAFLLVAPAAIVYLLTPKSGAGSKKKPVKPPRAADSAQNVKPDPLPLKPFLTTYRAFMLIMTCVAILAVDFRLFPRRFAKVETWGTSLMDMGVGSFVFTGGLVAARPVLRDRAAGKELPFISRLLGSIRHALPLFVLGFIRLLSVKGLDYAEHVTEYGVHWNFFFTVGLLPPFVAASRAALKLVPSHAALALIIGGVYQVLLETTDLKAYVLAAPRVDLISKNREGIFSFVGYLAIFLTGQDLGMIAIPRRLVSKNTSSGAQRNNLLLTLGVWAAIWWALYGLATSYRWGLGLDVSRRMANLPYVLWVAAFNSGAVLVFCVIDTICFPAFYNASDARSEQQAYRAATSPVARAYNRNGLAVFLVANLLTGLVNMTFNTLEATPPVALAILMGYSIIVTGVAVVLDMYDISIKL